MGRLEISGGNYFRVNCKRKCSWYLGILYGAGEVAEDGVEIWNTLQGSFTQLSAYSFLIFNLLCAPCFAAIGAIKREMGNAKWTWAAVGYQTGLAYFGITYILSIRITVYGKRLWLWNFGCFSIISRILISVI